MLARLLVHIAGSFGAFANAASVPTTATPGLQANTNGNQVGRPAVNQLSRDNCRNSCVVFESVRSEDSTDYGAGKCIDQIRNAPEATHRPRYPPSSLLFTNRWNTAAHNDALFCL